MRLRAIALAAAVAMIAVSCSAQGGGTPTPATSSQAGSSLGSSTTPQAATPITIVMIQPLTGPSSFSGQQSVNGAQVALEQVNGKGGVLGHRVNLVVQDDASDKAQTAILMQKYGPDTSVLAIIGPTFSSDFVATAPLAAQFRVPYVSAGSTAPWPGQFNDWTFRVSLPGAAFLPTLVKDLVAKTPIKTAAQIYAVDNNAQASQDQLLATLFPQNGVTVTADEAAHDNDTNFSAQITKIMQRPPDVIAIGLVVNDAGLFMQQARRMGYKGLFMSNGTQLTDPKMYSISQGAADGLIVGSSFDATDPSAIVKDFVSAFQAKYNRAPTAQDAIGYDAFNILANAIKTAGTATDRTKVRDALGRTTGYQGVSGSFTYNGKGDNTTPTVYVLKLTANGFVAY